MEDSRSREKFLQDWALHYDCGTTHTWKRVSESLSRAMDIYSLIRVHSLELKEIPVSKKIDVRGRMGNINESCRYIHSLLASEITEKMKSRESLKLFNEIGEAVNKIMKNARQADLFMCE